MSRVQEIVSRLEEIEKDEDYRSLGIFLVTKQIPFIRPPLDDEML